VLNIQDGELWLCVASDHEEPDIDVTLTPIRQVTGDELEAWQSVKSRLSEATVNSSFHLLTGDAVRALASCFELIESWHDEPSRATERCERIFAQAFMCNEQELDAAVAVVARYERELQTVGGGTICFQTISATPAANTSHSIDLQWVENADAITVRRVLRQSREMLKISVQMVDQETLAFDT
jgi:hypothetical protein